MPSKPGRPATSGTTYGKGVGHGPAKGSRTPNYSASNQPSLEAKLAGRDVAAEIRERISVRRNEIVDAQLLRALDLAHPQGHQASSDLLDRIAPKINKNEVSGPEGGPMPFVLLGEQEAETAEEWQEQHAPK